MTFTIASPWALLSLVSLPVIYWLHRFVIVGKPRQVSHIGLWMDLEETLLEGDSPRKVPLNLVLFFELLAALLLCLWLADVNLVFAPKETKRIAVIVDVSASMGASDNRGRAIDQIPKALQEFTDRDPSTRFSLITAGRAAKLWGDMSLGELRKTLRGISPHATEWRLDAALSAAESLQVSSESTLIFSDDAQTLHSRAWPVGAPTDNTAIVHASWPHGKPAFVSIRRFGKATRVSYVVRSGKRTLKEGTLSLSANGEQPLTLDLDDSIKEISVELEDDALKIDNLVHLPRPTERRVRVSIKEASPQLRQALERAFRAHPQFTQVHSPPYELVIGPSDTSNVPARSLRLTFASSTDRSQLQFGLNADPFAPLLKGFTTPGLVWSASAQQAPQSSQVLLSSQESALIFSNKNELYVNIDLKRSNLLSHSAFPILLFNLASQLDRTQGGLPRLTFRQGEHLSFARRKEWQGPVTILAPDESSSTFAPGQSILFGRLDSAGLYRLQVDKMTTSFAVNFLNPQESDLSQRNKKPRSLSATPKRARELRPPTTVKTVLLLLSLLSMALAWLLLARPQGPTVEPLS